MAITSGFYNSVSGDRLYNAQQMSAIFDGIIVDGIFASVLNSFVITQDTGLNMKVNVGSGRAWFNHVWILNDAAVLITLANAHATLSRIDVVYLQVDESTGVRAAKVDKLTGVAATNPVAPALTNTATVHQYALAHVLVGPAVTKITQANIDNKVGTTATPFVTGPLGGVSVSTLLAQWETQFMDWFEFLEGVLDENTAANLLAKIVDIVGNTNPAVIDLLELKTHTHASGLGNPVVTAGIADDAVTLAKIGPQVAAVAHHVGGNATDWDIQGSTIYTSTKIGRIVVGVSRWTGAAINNGILNVLWYNVGGGGSGWPFSGKPVVLVNCISHDDVIVIPELITTTGFQIRWSTARLGGATKTIVTFNWEAVGPE